jgi:hypothetical protein
MRKPTITSTLLVLAWTMWQTPTQAQDPWLLFDGCRWFWPSLGMQWQQRQCWCPDDYCPKTLPCVPPTARGCVDDYCPKALPWVPPNARGCVDDYCPRPCPLWLGKWCESWYRCGPCPGTHPQPCQRDLSRP